MDNFYITAERMYNDLDLLYNEKRWFNACYFSGYVVECYAKLIISQTLSTTPSEIKKFSHDLDKLEVELQSVLNSFIIGGRIPPSYICDIKNVCPTICTGTQKWHPNHRYSGDITRWGELTAQSYYNEVNEIILKILQMKIDGVIV